MSKNKELGQRLREARENHGMAADELGRRLGSSGQAYRRYERGEVMPKIDQLLDICDILGVTLDSIVFGETDKAAIEVTVRPGDRVVIRADNVADDEPYRSPVKISARKRVVEDVDIVESVKK